MNYSSVCTSMSSVHSKLQLQVLNLYRNLLRATAPKRTEYPHSTEQLTLRETVRSEFRRQASLYKRTDILQIESALRRGQRRLEDFTSGTVDRITHHRIEKGMK